VARLDRRGFIKGFGAAGALGGAAMLGARNLIDDRATAEDANSTALGLSRSSTHTTMDHEGDHVVGTGVVDHHRNGFDPAEILTDFDEGTVSKDATGNTVREYRFVVTTKPIEIAQGVFFPAWTYNGRVPGPTIRATEGDRIRVHLINHTDHPHTLHFHGFHPARMDGVPGAGEVMPGEEFTYDFLAGPFGTHLYHCHSTPLALHISRGLYGAFIVDPKQGRPPAHEMVMVMNAFDTNFDDDNDIYAINTVAFAYMNDPIRINAGELQRAHVINVTEFDLLNSIHLHANFFHLYRTGTSLRPDGYTDTISMGQGERHMIEFSYSERGRFMFHAHQTEFAEAGWMSAFQVS
jgi:FtsP/CotA-like multicopper oxidase with cupredoxin domain